MNNNKTNILRLTLTAAFIAVIAVMSFTPVGSKQFISLSTLHASIAHCELSVCGR